MNSPYSPVPPHVRDQLDTLVKGLYAAPEDHPILNAAGLQGVPCNSYQGDEEVCGVSVAGSIAASIKDIDGVLLNFYFKCRLADNQTEDLTIPGAPIEGGFIRIGKPTPTVLTVADYFCGLALHYATGHSVAVTVYESNLEPVAMALRKRFPDSKLVLCGNNHSVSASFLNFDLVNRIAKMCNAQVAKPGRSDTFIQLFQLKGKEAVEAAVEAALDAEDVIDFSASQDTWGFPAEPPPNSSGVNGEAMLASIIALLDQYVVLQPGAAIAAALWVVLTHTMDVARVAPILAILSPVRRCGKTTLLAILMRLVFRAMPSANLTPAVLFRTIDSWAPTLLIDEADTHLTKSPELTGVLNSGHTRDTAYVQRMGKGNIPQRFCTFSPKAIAMIGTLQETLMDRSIAIHQQRKRQEETRSKLRQGPNVDIAAIRARISRWALDNRQAIASAQFDLPDLGNDRAADNWEPLLAIAHAIGPKCFEQATEAAILLTQVQDSFSCTSEDLLRDIQTVFKRTKAKRFATVQLISFLCADDESPWSTIDGGRTITPRGLRNLLAPFAIKSKNLRISSTEVIKGYELTQFEDAFSRYVTAHRK